MIQQDLYTLARLLSEYQIRCRESSDISDVLPVLFGMTCKYHRARVIELGVRSGNSTAAFLSAVHFVQGRLWSVDVNPMDVPLWWEQLVRWKPLIEDDRSGKAAEFLPDECDILFIDTSHEYEHTVTELHLHAPRVARGGRVLCHDTCFRHPPGSEDVEFPVAKALGEYAKENGHAWFNIEISFGLGVMYV